MPQVASTIYDSGLHPWFNNLNDRIDYQRKFTAGDGETKRIAQAMLSQNPLTPDEEIRQNMTTRKFPPRFGYNTEELTVRQILANNFQTEADVAEWNNFSSSSGEINSSSRNVNNIW
jgi:hypothetical protein